MALADLFANNALVRLVTGDRARFSLAVSLIGVKTGERILLVGTGEGALLAALAAKAGLSGHVCGLDERPDATARAEAAAAKAGVLVDVRAQAYDTLPFDADAFDVVAIRPDGSLADETRLVAVLGEAHRVLRHGGRVVVVLDTARRGLAGLVSPGGSTPPPRVSADLARLTSAGFKGARLLAARDGWTFVEAAKPGRVHHQS